MRIVDKSRRTLFCGLALVAVPLLPGALVLTPSVAVAGGGATGGSTEYTQWLNNLELIQTARKAAETVTQVLELKRKAIEQLRTMTENLKILAPGELAAVVSPFAGTYDDLRRLAAAVTSLRTAHVDLEGLWRSSTQEMRGLGMSPSQFLQSEIALARRRGGHYETKMKRDIATLDRVADRVQALRALEAKIPGIEGNVQGLSLLIQTSSLVAQETIDIKSAMVEMNYRGNDQDRLNQISNEIRSKVSEETAMTLRLRRERDRAANVTFRSPWDRD